MDMVVVFKRGKVKLHRKKIGILFMFEIFLKIFLKNFFLRFLIDFNKY